MALANWNDQKGVHREHLVWLFINLFDCTPKTTPKKYRNTFHATCKPYSVIIYCNEGKKT